MNRRRFFGALGFGAGATAFFAMTGAQPALAIDQYHRLSVEKGDPGERPYASLVADGLWPEVYLDGVKQQAITADVAEGFVKRHVTTASGNLAINPATNEILTETVRGRVEIRLVEHRGYQRS